MQVRLPSTPHAIPPAANRAAGKSSTEEVVVGVREHGHSAKRRRVSDPEAGADLDVASSAIPGLNASLPDSDPHTEIPPFLV
ncbi:hypothetical protein L208DRAFT_1406209 [Tricholoma matsutake]|nr:hypothetical protein L208DRAFT_1406209 [Tricholoma matsutake 945]